jgi:outer membrane protein
LKALLVCIGAALLTASGSPAAGQAGPPAPEGESLPGAAEETQARGLTLEDLFHIAAARSERIGRAREQYNRAVAQRRSALARVLPNITVEDSYFRQNQVELAPTGGVGSAFSFNEDRNDLYVQLSQPIFAGFRDQNLLRSAARSIEAERIAIDEARRLLYADVAQAFYTALQRQGEAEVLEDSVTVQRERLREVKARQEVGLARRTELLLVEAQLAENEADLVRARNDFAVARQRLGFLVGEPVPGGLADAVVLPDDVVGDAPPHIGEAVAARSDMRELEQRVQAARHRMVAARGEYAPSIDLEARRYLDRYNVSTFAEETDWTAELTFSLPLFDGGSAQANIRTARAELTQAELNRDERARLIGLEIDSAWRTLQSDLARRRTLETSVASADENYRLVSEEYRGGLSTNLEVITAQNLLLSSRLNLQRQRYQVKLDWVALRIARGELAGAGRQ